MTFHAPVHSSQELPYYWNYTSIYYRYNKWYLYCKWSHWVIKIDEIPISHNSNYYLGFFMMCTTILLYPHDPIAKAIETGVCTRDWLLCRLLTTQYYWMSTNLIMYFYVIRKIGHGIVPNIIILSFFKFKSAKYIFLRETIFLWNCTAQFFCLILVHCQKFPPIRWRGGIITLLYPYEWYSLCLSDPMNALFPCYQ